MEKTKYYCQECGCEFYEKYEALITCPNCNSSDTDFDTDENIKEQYFKERKKWYKWYRFYKFNQ